MDEQQYVVELHSTTINDVNGSLYVREFTVDHEAYLQAKIQEPDVAQWSRAYVLLNGQLLAAFYNDLHNNRLYSIGFAEGYSDERRFSTLYCSRELVIGLWGPDSTSLHEANVWAERVLTPRFAAAVMIRDSHVYAAYESPGQGRVTLVARCPSNEK